MGIENWLVCIKALDVFVYQGIYLKIFDQLIFVLLVNSSSECKAKTKSQQTLLIGLPAIFAPTRMSI